MSQLRTKALLALSRSVLGALLIGATLTGLLFGSQFERAMDQASSKFQRGADLIADRARDRSGRDIDLVRALAAFRVATDGSTLEETRIFRDAIGGGSPTLFYGFIAEPRGGPGAIDRLVWGRAPTAYATGAVATLHQDCAASPAGGGIRAIVSIDPADGMKYRALLLPVLARGGQAAGCIVSFFPSGLGVAGAFLETEAQAFRGYLYSNDGTAQSPWLCFLGGVGLIDCPVDAPSRDAALQPKRYSFVTAVPLGPVAGAPQLVIVPAEPHDWRSFIDRVSIIILVLGTIATLFAARQRYSIARSQFEIEHRELLYRTLIRDVPIAFVGWDGDGQIYEWNPNAELLFGWTAADALGRAIKDRVMVPPAAAALVLEPPEAIIQDRFEEFELCRADGTVFHGEILQHVMRAEGVWRCTAFVRDISELRRSRESVLKAARMVGAAELASGFAHDFNNALTVVIGSLELLAPAVARDPGPLEDLSAARDSARRAADLAARMLTLVRERTPLDIELTLDPELKQMLSEIERVAGPRVTVASALAAPGARVFVDRSWLHSALLNLVLNAHHAMPDGGTLLLTTRRGLQPGQAPAALRRSGEFVAIEVSDTGSGMTPEVAARAFETFFTTRPPGVGTGLGLSMVRAFAREHGGDVLIESKLGVGTTVRILLPLVAVDAGAP